MLSSRAEAALRDSARRIWRETVEIGGELPAAEQADDGGQWETAEPAERRRSLGSRLASALVTLFLALLLLWLLIGLYIQFRLPGLERKALCTGTATGKAAPLDVARLDFRTDEPCHPLRLTVERGKRYIVDFEVVDPWKDGRKDTDPRGLAAGDLRFPFGYLGIPFRRIVASNYLQPAYEIRYPKAAWQFFQPVFIEPLDVQRQGDSSTSWRAEFEAKRSGELSLFVNEGVLPFARFDRFNVRYFYSTRPFDNAGSACVTIRRADLAAKPPPAAAGEICKRSDVRNGG